MSRTTKGGRGRAALAAVVLVGLAGRAEAQYGPGYITPFNAMGPGYYGSPFANFGPGYFGAFGFAGPGYFAGSPFANPNVTAIPYTTYGFGLPYMGYGYGFGPGYGFAVGPYNNGYGSGYGGLSATNANLANARASQAYSSAALTEQQAIGTMLNNYRMLQAMSPFQTFNTTTAMPTQAHYQRQRRAPTRAPMPREKVIGDDGQILWPKGTPRGDELDRLRGAAEKAVATVAREQRVDGQATVADTIDAERKVSAFGRAALAKLRESNAPNVADFEHFLRSLDHNVQGLADAAPAANAGAGNKGNAPPPAGNTRPANTPKNAGDVLRDAVKDKGNK